MIRPPKNYQIIQKNQPSISKNNQYLSLASKTQYGITSNINDKYKQNKQMPLLSFTSFQNYLDELNYKQQIQQQNRRTYQSQMKQENQKFYSKSSKQNIPKFKHKRPSKSINLHLQTENICPFEQYFSSSKNRQFIEKSLTQNRIKCSKSQSCNYDQKQYYSHKSINQNQQQIQGWQQESQDFSRSPSHILSDKNLLKQFNQIKQKSTNKHIKQNILKEKTFNLNEKGTKTNKLRSQMINTKNHQKQNLLTGQDQNYFRPKKSNKFNCAYDKENINKSQSHKKNSTQNIKSQKLRTITSYKQKINEKKQNQKSFQQKYCHNQSPQNQRDDFQESQNVFSSIVLQNQKVKNQLTSINQLQQQILLSRRDQIQINTKNFQSKENQQPLRQANYLNSNNIQQTFEQYKNKNSQQSYNKQVNNIDKKITSLQNFAKKQPNQPNHSLQKGFLKQNNVHKKENTIGSKSRLNSLMSQQSTEQILINDQNSPYQQLSTIKILKKQFQYLCKEQQNDNQKFENKKSTLRQRKISCQNRIIKSQKKSISQIKQQDTKYLTKNRKNSKQRRVQTQKAEKTEQFNLNQQKKSTLTACKSKNFQRFPNYQRNQSSIFSITDLQTKNILNSTTKSKFPGHSAKKFEYIRPKTTTNQFSFWNITQNDFQNPNNIGQNKRQIFYFNNPLTQKHNDHQTMKYVTKNHGFIRSQNQRTKYTSGTKDMNKNKLNYFLSMKDRKSKSSFQNHKQNLTQNNRNNSFLTQVSVDAYNNQIQKCLGMAINPTYINNRKTQTNSKSNYQAYSLMNKKKQRLLTSTDTKQLQDQNSYKTNSNINKIQTVQSLSNLQISGQMRVSLSKGISEHQQGNKQTKKQKIIKSLSNLKDCDGNKTKNQQNFVNLYVQKLSHNKNLLKKVSNPITLGSCLLKKDNLTATNNLTITQLQGKQIKKLRKYLYETNKYENAFKQN